MTRPDSFVAVISDTHGLLRPQAVSALEGAECVVHAGDVGEESILHRLEKIAPVTVVRGNTDYDAWARRLPATDVLQWKELSVYVVHDIADLDVDPAAGGFNVVVYGHSHRPASELRDGVLFLNPGSAGPRRFDLPVSVARLRVRAGRPDCEIVRLQV